MDNQRQNGCGVLLNFLLLKVRKLRNKRPPHFRGGFLWFVSSRPIKNELSNRFLDEGREHSTADFTIIAVTLIIKEEYHSSEEAIWIIYQTSQSL